MFRATYFGINEGSGRRRRRHGFREMWDENNKEKKFRRGEMCTRAFGMEGVAKERD